MKQLLTFCALVLGLTTGLAISASAAEAGCPSDLSCEKIEWRTTTCEDLRTAIATHEAVSYGSSLYFNLNIAPTNNEQTDFCEARYGSQASRAPALPTRTQDVFTCALNRVAFKCGRDRVEH